MPLLLLLGHDRMPQILKVTALDECKTIHPVQDGPLDLLGHLEGGGGNLTPLCLYARQDDTWLQWVPTWFAYFGVQVAKEFLCNLNLSESKLWYTNRFSNRKPGPDRGFGGCGASNDAKHFPVANLSLRHKACRAEEAKLAPNAPLGVDAGETPNPASSSANGTVNKSSYWTLYVLS